MSMQKFWAVTFFTSNPHTITNKVWPVTVAKPKYGQKPYKLFILVNNLKAIETFAALVTFYTFATFETFASLVTF